MAREQLPPPRHSASKTRVNALEAGEGRAAPHLGHELILRAAYARCKLHVSKPLTRRRFVAGKPQDATIVTATHSPELIDPDSSRTFVHGRPFGCRYEEIARHRSKPVVALGGLGGNAFTSQACGGTARRAASAMRARCIGFRQRDFPRASARTPPRATAGVARRHHAGGRGLADCAHPRAGAGGRRRRRPRQ